MNNQSDKQRCENIMIFDALPEVKQKDKIQNLADQAGGGQDKQE